MQNPNISNMVPFSLDMISNQHVSFLDLLNVFHHHTQDFDWDLLKQKSPIFSLQENSQFQGSLEQSLSPTTPPTCLPLNSKYKI